MSLGTAALHAAQIQDGQIIASTTAVFSETFKRTWQASSESEPFRSIRGDYDSAFSGWSATAILPGAYECHVYKPSGGWMRAGTDFEDAVYDCSFQVPPEHNEKSFEQIVHSIRSLLPKMETRERTHLPRMSGSRWGVTDHRVGRSIFLVLPSDEREARRYPKKICFTPRSVEISWSNSTRLWYEGGRWHESDPVADLHLRLTPATTFSRNQTGTCPAPYLTNR